MKVILLIFLFVGGAWAQDLSDPARMVNGQRVNLQPLFHWWTNTTALNATNATRTNGNQVAVPPRPLTAWVRVASNQLTNTGFVWLAHAYIQETPDGPVTNQLIVLRHGPFEEKKRFDQVVNDYKMTSTNLLVASNSYVKNAEKTAAFDQKADLYLEMYEIDPWQHYRLGYAADAYRQAANQTQQKATTAARQMEQFDAKRAELQKITQDRETLEVDSFALRTTERYRGLPVYDMGLRFGR
jgi:hypothetical protein